MSISIETLALAKKYADKLATAGSAEAFDKAMTQAISASKLYTDTVVKDLAGLKVLIVDSLPISNIDSHVLYLVPMATPMSENAYYEYLYVNNAWELIGSTKIDLSDYYTKKEVEQYFKDNQYVLPIASPTTLGGVKVDNKTVTIDSTGTLTVLLDEVVETSSVLENKITTTTQQVVDSNFTSITDEEISNLF